MDPAVARERLLAERAEVLSLLHLTDEDTEEAQESEQETGDIEDAAQPLTAEGTDGAIADTLQDRLAQIDRALKRLDEGTWGVSVRSGTPIPAERLEADPAAELTVEEAASRQ
jgi:DnaK suppressor protein